MTLEIIEGLIIVFLIMAYFGKGIRWKRGLDEVILSMDELTQIARVAMAASHQTTAKYNQLRRACRDYFSAESSELQDLALKRIERLVAEGRDRENA